MVAKTPSKRPGGRNEAVRHAVVAAVLDLIREHGLEFGHVDVAERAGVHHTTVYRRWPAKSDLLREAMSEQYRRFDVRRVGDFMDDLHEICQRFVAYAAEPVQRVQLLIGPLILVPLFTRKKLQRKQVRKIVDRILFSHMAICKRPQR